MSFIRTGIARPESGEDRGGLGGGPRHDPALAGVTLSVNGIAQLMPMFLRLDRDGRIIEVGSTLAKVLGENVSGQPMEKVFRVGRGWAPNGGFRGEPGHTMGDAQFEALPDPLRIGDWSALPGRRVYLGLTRHPDIQLRGVCVPLGSDADGVLLNLSFGIHLSDAVRRFALSDADFAPTDLAMELLYLQEAKAAVLGELRGLTTRLEAARAAAHDKAMTDALTGLANRRAFDFALGRSVAGVRHGGAPFAVAHLDLDHFKAVNDTLGHAAGDFILEQVSRILREETRQGDLAARVGGDEFILLLRSPVDPGAIEAMTQRIIGRLERPVTFEGRECRISGSFGVALSSQLEVLEAERLLAMADAALYRSKSAGRGCCSFAGDNALEA